MAAKQYCLHPMSLIIYNLHRTLVVKFGHTRMLQPKSARCWLLDAGQFSPLWQPLKDSREVLYYWWFIRRDTKWKRFRVYLPVAWHVCDILQGLLLSLLLCKSSLWETIKIEVSLNEIKYINFTSINNKPKSNLAAFLLKEETTVLLSTCLRVFVTKNYRNHCCGGALILVCALSCDFQEQEVSTMTDNGLLTGCTLETATEPEERDVVTDSYTLSKWAVHICYCSLEMLIN